MANLENQLIIFRFHLAFLEKIFYKNRHESTFFESSKNIGLSVYFDSQNDIELTTQKYGQGTGSTHIAKKT